MSLVLIHYVKTTHRILPAVQPPGLVANRAEADASASARDPAAAAELQSLAKDRKAALDDIQQEIALRWQKQGIKVVTLLPGRVLTHGEPTSGRESAVDIKDSISGMIRVLDKLTPEQGGQTIQWDGERIE